MFWLPKVTFILNIFCKRWFFLENLSNYSRIIKPPLHDDLIVQTMFIIFQEEDMTQTRIYGTCVYLQMFSNYNANTLLKLNPVHKIRFHRSPKLNDIAFLSLILFVWFQPKKKKKKNGVRLFESSISFLVDFSFSFSLHSGRYQYKNTQLISVLFQFYVLAVFHIDIMALTVKVHVEHFHTQHTYTYYFAFQCFCFFFSFLFCFLCFLFCSVKGAMEAIVTNIHEYVLARTFQYSNLRFVRLFISFVFLISQSISLFAT